MSTSYSGSVVLDFDSSEEGPVEGDAFAGLSAWVTHREKGPCDHLCVEEASGLRIQAVGERGERVWSVALDPVIEGMLGGHSLICPPFTVRSTESGRPMFRFARSDWKVGQRVFSRRIGPFRRYDVEIPLEQNSGDSWGDLSTLVVGETPIVIESTKIDGDMVLVSVLEMGDARESLSRDSVLLVSGELRGSRRVVASAAVRFIRLSQ